MNIIILMLLLHTCLNSAPENMATAKEERAKSGDSSQSYFTRQPGKKCRVCIDFKSWTKTHTKVEKLFDVS